MSAHPVGRPFVKGQSGNPGGRPRVVAEVRELTRAHAPEAITELVRLTKEARSEATRIAAIKELLDRAYGKATQFVAAANDEPSLKDLNIEELRVKVFDEIENLFPEYRIVRTKRLNVISSSGEPT